MADKSIRNDFIEGVQEIFTTLFNDGSEETDGIFYYALSDKTVTNIYGETKSKLYKQPVLLVASAHLSPEQGQQTVEGVKDIPSFTTTYQSLTENGLGVTNADLVQMRRGLIKFHDVFYEIDNIKPKAYVEDAFIMYDLECTEKLDISDVEIEPEESGE